MSSSGIPYHLRSHKAVDRRLFVDLLTRIERWNSLKDAVYVSMGAYPLEDHRLVHRQLGITKLISFDYDEAIVARQNFNKPVETCKCTYNTSGDVTSGLDRIIDECGYGDARHVIVWLDYTKPREIGIQIREFQSLLEKLAEGDVIRVTVNADPKQKEEKEEIPVLVTKTMERHYDFLKGAIGEFLPSSSSAKDMTRDGFPVLLSQAFAAAALETFPASGAEKFMPLSIVRYADTTQMLSISGMVVRKRLESRVWARLGLGEWPFASSDWRDVKDLVVPSLTLRERLYLERGVLDKSDDELVAALGFEKAGSIDVKAFLKSYKEYYRFYPTLLPADL